MQGSLWRPAYVGVGSNLDDPAAQVERAFAALAAIRETRLVLRSALYATAPFGPVAQPDFINAVAGLLTLLSPESLLDDLRAIEAAFCILQRKSASSQVPRSPCSVSSIYIIRKLRTASVSAKASGVAV